MPPGIYNSSLTRVQPFFEQLFDRDATGGSWLPRLFAAAPSAHSALGDIADEPGALIRTLLGPHPSSAAPRACFEFEVPPPRRLLQWFIDHPDRIRWPASRTFGEETTRMRRALLEDEPPGREAAQADALRLIDERSPSDRGWWRFEGSSSIDCVIATDRLVITIEGKRTEPLSPSTDWYPARTQLVRNLEAARQLAHGRRWGTLLMSEALIPEGAFASVAASLDDAAPHLAEAEHAELQAAYLGNMTWSDACAAVSIDPKSLPDTAPSESAG
jgi:hypothetical protein